VWRNGMEWMDKWQRVRNIHKRVNVWMDGWMHGWQHSYQAPRPTPTLQQTNAVSAPSNTPPTQPIQPLSR